MMCRTAARVAVLTIGIATVWSLCSQAQTAHGTPPSVTSLGFGGTGNAPHGLPPSVTSLGPSHFGGVPSPGQHHHRHNPGYGAVYYFPYAYPYVVDGPPTDADNEDENDTEQAPDGRLSH